MRDPDEIGDYVLDLEREMARLRSDLGENPTLRDAVDQSLGAAIDRLRKQRTHPRVLSWQERVDLQLVLNAAEESGIEALTDDVEALRIENAALCEKLAARELVVPSPQPAAEFVQCGWRLVTAAGKVSLRSDVERPSVWGGRGHPIFVRREEVVEAISDAPLAAVSPLTPNETDQP